MKRGRFHFLFFSRAFPRFSARRPILPGVCGFGGLLGRAFGADHFAGLPVERNVTTAKNAENTEKGFGDRLPACALAAARIPASCCPGRYARAPAHSGLRIVFHPYTVEFRIFGAAGQMLHWLYWLRWLYWLFLQGKERKGRRHPLRVGPTNNTNTTNRARRGEADGGVGEADAAQAERVVAKAESRKQKVEIGPATTRRVAEELRRRGWREAELTLPPPPRLRRTSRRTRRRKADPDQAEMAWRLRRGTTMTLKWIAKRLKVGVWTHVSNCLVQKRKQNENCQ